MDRQLIEQSKRLDHWARHDVDALDAIYSDDFLIHRLDSSGETMVLDKHALIAFFSRQANDGDAPQEMNTVDYLHASTSGKTGVVVGRRTMQTSENPVDLVFTQIWQRKTGGWQMIRESVYAQTK